MKNVKTRARLTKTCVGGDCCVPKAVRKKAKTMTMRVKLVITSTSEGAITSSVMIRTILSVATSSVGSCGVVSDKSTEGNTGFLGSEGSGAIFDGAGRAGVRLAFGESGLCGFA